MAAAAFDAWRDNDMNLEPPLACAQTMYVLVSRPISRGKPIGRWEPIVGVSPTSDETALTPQSLFGMACCRNATRPHLRCDRCGCPGLGFRISDRTRREEGPYMKPEAFQVGLTYRVVHVHGAVSNSG